MDQQAQSQPQKKRNYSLFYVVGFIAILAILMYSMGACSSGPPRGTFTDFTRDIGFAGGEQRFICETENPDIPANKIWAVIQRGNNFYVLLKGFDDPQKVAKFRNSPSEHADYYFYYYAIYDISAILTEYNNFVDGLAGVNTPEYNPSFTSEYQVEFIPLPAPSSWFSFTNLLSILSLAVVIFVGYLIFRSFSGRSGGLGNMSRNRATHTMGGQVRFTDVAGIDEEKEEVQEIVQFLQNPRKFLELGARIPKGVLLVGQPGTGKTLLAKAIAGEAGVHFFSISGSDFSEMLVGVGPSRMRDLFETAKLNAPAIIFIDEIDSIARMRGVGVSGVSDENEQTLNQLLVQMDGFTKSEGVIVLAATNRPDVLDQAVLRPGRFDRQIVIQMPDVKGREQILKVHAKSKPLGNDVDLKRVAQIISGFSGADIENLLNESAIIAAKKDKKKINMSDITEGVNKVLLGPQKRSRIITEDDKKITAYHEAGHAIVSRILQPDQVVQEVSIIPRGMAAGYTLTNDKDDVSHHKSRKFLCTQLAVFMAGRVAEQIFIGDICTGASNDLKVATSLAERMVTMFGMSDKLGPLYYAKEDDVALRLYHAQNPHSESLQSIIDDEVKSLIIAAEKSAVDILKAQKPKVDIMSQILLERETIYAADIALIMIGKSVKEVIAEMEKRDSESRVQEKQDKIDAELALLDRDLEFILKRSKDFVNAKLAPPEKLDELKKNMELARDVIRKGQVLKHLPTLDNLETYATLIAEQESDDSAVDEESAEVTNDGIKPDTTSAVKKTRRKTDTPTKTAD